MNERPSPVSAPKYTGVPMINASAAAMRSSTGVRPSFMAQWP